MNKLKTCTEKSSTELLGSHWDQKADNESKEHQLVSGNGTCEMCWELMLNGVANISM